jgi:16S rRNA (cytosine967-C5)-methyltransferase
MRANPKPNIPPDRSHPRSIAEIAAGIIEEADRDHPADAILRQALRREPNLSPEDARDISRRVFAYYRWHGWLDHQKGMAAAVNHAFALATRFDEHPDAITLAALRERAAPSWIFDEVPASEEWLRSLQSEPPVWIRARRGSADEVAAKLPGCVPGILPDALLYRGEEDLFRTPAFHAGEFELQDISSQAVGIVCDPRPGETWWDACAGEGGKTLHLSSLMSNKGLIWASDRAAWRLQRLKRRTARAGVFNYRSAPWDGGVRLPTKTKFDGVLVDAPCSGAGTWQRNPHARWTTTLNDVKELAGIQFNMLRNTVKGMKPGGKLVYSVCTNTTSETRDVADQMESECPALTPIPVPNPLQPGLPPATRLMIWPQDSAGNGMFIAAWKLSAV